MSDDGKKRYDGPIHDGPSRTSPYPLSRLAPPHDLVDTAHEIARADEMLGTVTHAKLGTIVEQIRALQDQARAILARAKRDGELHRAKCNFEKRIGKVYHLYRRDDGETYFAMLGPDEWTRAQPQTYLGSYRLEPDMSYTPIDEIEDRDAEIAVLKRLAGG